MSWCLAWCNSRSCWHIPGPCFGAKGVPVCGGGGWSPSHHQVCSHTFSSYSLQPAPPLAQTRDVCASAQVASCTSLYTQLWLPSEGTPQCVSAWVRGKHRQTRFLESLLIVLRKYLDEGCVTPCQHRAVPQTPRTSQRCSTQRGEQVLHAADDGRKDLHPVADLRDDGCARAMRAAPTQQDSKPEGLSFG